MVNPGRGVAIGIVPDGVTRVQWVFSGTGVGIAHPRPVTVTPQLHNNVALAPVEPGEGPLAHATWYAHDGHVIRQAGETPAARQQLQTIAAVNASRGRPIAPQLRDHFSLFRSTPPDTPAQDWRLPTPGTTGGYISQMHLNYWQTRYIPNATGLDGAGLWITPGTHGLCISDPQTNVCGKLSDRILDGFVGGATVRHPRRDDRRTRARRQPNSHPHPRRRHQANGTGHRPQCLRGNRPRTRRRDHQPQRLRNHRPTIPQVGDSERARHDTATNRRA